MAAAPGADRRGRFRRVGVQLIWWLILAAVCLPTSPDFVTGQLKRAESADQFLNILQAAMDAPIFHHSLATCAYLQLGLRNKKGELTRTTTSLELLKLNARALEMIQEGQLNVRTLTFLLWSLKYLDEELFPEVADIVPTIIAEISLKAKDMEGFDLRAILVAACRFNMPGVIDILPAVVPQIPGMVKDMTPGELSDVLWVAGMFTMPPKHPRQSKRVRLSRCAIDILPSVVSQIPVKVKDMTPGELSDVLWAAGCLKDDARHLVDIVPSIAAEIQAKAKKMKPRELSNVLWAAASLKDAAPDVIDILPSIGAEIQAKVKKMSSFELSKVLWVAADLKDVAPAILDDMVRAVASASWRKGKHMTYLELSRFIWAGKTLKDHLPLGEFCQLPVVILDRTHSEMINFQKKQSLKSLPYSR